MTANQWFQSFGGGPNAATPAESAPRLLCFPHAGGSASFFAPAGVALAPELRVAGVQYPGRQERRHEDPVRTVADLADQIAALLPDWSGEDDVAFLGHSYGAVVAFEVAVRLQAQGRPPVRIFASGRHAPSITRVKHIHTLDDDGVLSELRLLSGTDPAFLADDELISMILPVVRADYAAVESYPGSDAVLSCPITVLMGRDDPMTDAQDIDAWSAHSSDVVDTRVFPGGHFFLSEQAGDVLDLIRTKMAVPVVSRAV